MVQDVSFFLNSKTREVLNNKCFFLSTFNVHNHSTLNNLNNFTKKNKINNNVICKLLL